MRQPSLFDPPVPEPRPVDVDFFRKHLRWLLRTARAAEIMPWHKVDADHWEREFPRLARHLPEEEGRAMLADFNAELARLKAATPTRIFGT